MNAPEIKLPIWLRVILAPFILLLVGVLTFTLYPLPRLWLWIKTGRDTKP